MECKDFLYFIDETSNVIYFNPVSTWENDGVCADIYSDEEDEFIESIVKDLGLAGAVECGYEPIKNKKVKGYESKLLKLGFVYNAKFSKFMKSCLDKVSDDDADLLDDDCLDEPEELNFD